MTPPDLRKYWTNRRRMAWMAFWSLLAVAVMAFVVDISDAQATVIASVSLALAAIIGAYIGFSTQHDIRATDMSESGEND